MSQNQIKGQKSELQYRKVTGGGRSFNNSGYQQRSSFGGTGNGRGNSPAPSLSSNRSFKKSNNAQAGQSKGISGSVNTPSAANPASSVRLVENGSRVQSTSPGVSPTPASAAISKSVDTSRQKSSPPIPKSPSSQSSSVTLNSPLKGEAGKGFPLQFGSINPGYNDMQVPARTSSAPPNMDEQQRDQARRAASRAAPAFPVPCAVKQQMPKKNDVSTEQSIPQETPRVSKVTRDVQVTSAAPPIQAQKPSGLRLAGISMPMPYHQSTVLMQFGGPNPQNQSQGMPTNLLQMPMPLPMGNFPQVQQQVVVPGLQHHVIHQGQSFGFNPQLGHQLPRQLVNIGMNMPPQFNPQQAGNFGSARKTVKITHPETHEELRLDDKDDGSPGSRSHHTGPPQSQPFPPYTATHPGGYYSTSYTAGSPFYPGPSCLPLTSSSQAPRVNYSGQAPPVIPFVNQSVANSFSTSKSSSPMQGAAELSNLDLARNARNMKPSFNSLSTPVTVEKASASAGERGKTNGVEKVKSHNLSGPAVEAGIIRKDLEVNADNFSPRNSSPQPESGFECSRQNASSVTRYPLQSGKKISVKSMVPDHGEFSMIPAFESEEAEINPTPSGLEEGAVIVGQDSLASFGAASTCDSSMNHTVENKAGKDQYAGQNDRLLQSVTKEQVEREVGGLRSDSSLKTMDVERCEQQAGIVEACQAKEATTSQTEDKNTAGQTFLSGHGSATSDSGSTLHSNALLSRKDNLRCGETYASKCTLSDNEVLPVSANSSEISPSQEREKVGTSILNSSSSTVSVSKKASLEPNKTKSYKRKNKRKEMLHKAEAFGTTADLYMAYKGLEEKKKNVFTRDSQTDYNLKEVSASPRRENSTSPVKEEQNKLELEDWEDAVDGATSKLGSFDTGKHQGTEQDDGRTTVKKYSRDFLLTFSEQCIDLPGGFEITSDIADIFMGFNANISRDHRIPGRIVDRLSGPVRLDRRGNGTMEVDRWGKATANLSVQDPRMDLAYESSMMGFRPGPVAPYGMLRNTRGQGPIQHAGGILSGPMHSMGFRGMHRNNPDGDRWQRATNFSKGLMPSPHTPSPVMHRAENKYEVGKVSDEEQAKQRRLKGILNKLTPQNFDKLFEQVKEVKIDNAVTLAGVISQIFDKALMEPTFCEMYANFCQHLASELPDLNVDDEKITFRRLLLNKCQEEFERGEREEEEANKDDDEGETVQSGKEREEKRLNARRRMLGNIRLIGELYKKRMLTERIMHECIKKLLGQYLNVDEENIEALCKLMSTIGEMIDHPKAKEHMDAYFDIMGQLSNNMKLSSRVRFLLRDTIDLRKNRWQQRRKVEGPKKIEEVHRDAAQERLGQASKSNRGPSMNTAMRRSHTVEFGPRASMLSSQVGQVGGFRGVGTQLRVYGGQDGRIDDRSVFENRTFSVPLSQHSSANESIMLGPQGGLARRMSSRGQPSVSASPTADNFSSHGDFRRVVGGVNGFSNASGCGAYSSTEDHSVKHTAERFGAPTTYDQSNSQELNSTYMNRDRSVRTSSAVAKSVAAPALTISSEKVWPEEHLRDKSIAAIREYYSAKDEKEVALCVKDLNAPSISPMVISTWVTDAFERKDLEREMLAKLLVSLTKSRDGTFNPQQLIEGFESVLTNLEDTVTDAPRAPEFLGRIFGKVILENVLPLKEVGTLIHQGGEEPGRLLEVGLAAEVLGSILEMIKLEKGESTLNEIRASSNLRVEDYLPPDPLRPRKLEMFV